MKREERDLLELEALVRSLPEREPGWADFFSGAGEVVMTRAPGRLDAMGGIADYSGSLVLELPLAEAACVAAARTDDAWVHVVSWGEQRREARFPASELFEACASVATARAYFARQSAAQRWVAYVLGGLASLVERGCGLSGGLRLLLLSAVPEGKGVSSSAAIEVAALSALAELWSVGLSGQELGVAAQRVENQIVGAPCGVMDQMTSACGEAGRLLALLCQPAILRDAVALPDGVSIFGIDSGLRHAVGGASYRRVRVAAFMGLRILAERLGARVVPSGHGTVLLEGDPLGGYLANLAPDRLTPAHRDALPERISGAEFLARFGGISDSATEIEPAELYMVRAATLHPILEHARVSAFAEQLPLATRERDLEALGALMFASHAGYSACGLGSTGTDQLVDAVRAAGAKSSLFGAKISGGGSGGTVAVLARGEALPALHALGSDYAAKTGRATRVFSGSSAAVLGGQAPRLML